LNPSTTKSAQPPIASPHDNGMNRRLVLLGNIAAFIFLADGLAMILSQSTSTSGGISLLLIAGGWFALALPRIVRTEVRPFLRVLIPKFGSVALPLLFLPVCGLWLVATPSALTVWFAVAWAGLWLLCLFSTVVIPCPLCGHTYGRVGVRVRPLARVCAQCGAGPLTTTA
jgi:hypothetical protein